MSTTCVGANDGERHGEKLLKFETRRNKLKMEEAE